MNVEPGSLAEAVRHCQDSATTGWDLVDHACRLVHDRFTTYSVLHVWESPETAFRRRRGFCTQYNGALAQMLHRLGFDTWLVYSPRVRFRDDDTWTLGHTWVRVRLDGEVRDVCARDGGNHVGHVGFTYGSRSRPLGPASKAVTSLGTALTASAALLMARLRGRARPRWVEHARRDSP
jgi:hypothetical protein